MSSVYKVTLFMHSAINVMARLKVQNGLQEIKWISGGEAGRSSYGLLAKQHCKISVKNCGYYSFLFKKKGKINANI
jgi:hypothetical protein